MAMEPILSSESPLLNNVVEDGSTDLKGRPVSRFLTGGWPASLLIIGVEMAERIAYFGISANLVTYLSNVMQQSTATAAKNINVWSGVGLMLTLIGAFVADSYLGRYWTILLSSLVYLLGLLCLTLSASLASLRPPPCDDTSYLCPRPAAFQVGFFFTALYLVTLGQGGHKPCLQAFGADQFDEGDPTERKHKISFFNWWNFCISIGLVVCMAVLIYIQENVGWGLGFGIPTIAMAISICVFLYGTRMYRHQLPSTSRATKIEHEHKTNIEEVKAVIKLLPIWVACLMCGVIYAQSPTLFTKQGSMMDRRIIGQFKIPAATLQSFIIVSTLVLLPVYDQIFVPLARTMTGNERGITLLQRIGVGMFSCVLSMIVAAMAEMKRLHAAKEYGLIDMPHATIPISIFWLLPQYILLGISNVFIGPGLQEFFYDQIPDTLKSLGIAFYLSLYGVANFLSSILISIIEELSSREGQNWFADNLNRAHLDYFYWLLAALGALFLCIYLSFASCFIYKKEETIFCKDEEIS